MPIIGFREYKQLIRYQKVKNKKGMVILVIGKTCALDNQNKKKINVDISNMDIPITSLPPRKITIRMKINNKPFFRRNSDFVIFLVIIGTL